MGAGTEISWADNTWPMILGCKAVSRGCDNCWAARDASGRLKHHEEYAGLASFGTFNGTVRVLPQRLDWPLKWRAPKRIFACSSSDLFHKDVPDEFIAKVLGVMAATPRHTYLVATKRHGRMRVLMADSDFRRAVYEEAWLVDQGGGLDPYRYAPTSQYRPPDYEQPAGQRGDDADWWPLRNLHLGVSVEDQWSAELRIPALLDTPAWVRWASYEPALDAVDLTRLNAGSRQQPGMVFDALNGRYGVPGQWQQATGKRLHWVVAGGESGPKARPSHPDWYRTVRDQCQAAGVPFHFKQWGEWLPLPVFDAPEMYGGRAVNTPTGGRAALGIRERGPSRTFRSGVTRPMEPGDRNGIGELLDRDWLAVRVGKGKAGRELDGRVWHEFPRPDLAGASR